VGQAIPAVRRAIAHWTIWDPMAQVSCQDQHSFRNEPYTGCHSRRTNEPTERVVGAAAELDVVDRGLPAVGEPLDVVQLQTPARCHGRRRADTTLACAGGISVSRRRRPSQGGLAIAHRTIRDGRWHRSRASTITRSGTSRIPAATHGGRTIRSTALTRTRCARGSGARCCRPSPARRRRTA
jgi:hypothetical protein